MKKAFLVFLFTGLFCSGCITHQDTEVKPVLADTKTIISNPETGEVLIGCRIYQDKDGAALFRFSRRPQGWAGCSEGVNRPHFIVMTDVKQSVCDEKIREAGAEAYRQFSVENAVKKMKSGKITEENFLDGTPVLISLRWMKDGKVKQVPFQKCFREKVIIDGKEVVKAYTPHLIYHGSGLLNKKINYGCLVCQQDCSGGLICNNQGPCCTPVPELQPDWNVIPPANTLVTLVIRVFPKR